MKRILVLGANGLLGTMFRENQTLSNCWVFSVHKESDMKDDDDVVFDCSTTDINRWSELLNGFDIAVFFPV